MKNYKKIISFVLALVISAGTAGSVIYTDKNCADTVSAASSEISGSSGNAKTESENIESKASKDETVYVLCSSNSSVKDIIVSDWLKNTNSISELEDVSCLKDIENLKGEESFSQDGDNLIWKAEGSDIYYKGSVSKELPVEMKMTYMLDGKEVEPESIKGKSGHLVIRWSYTNNTSVKKKIAGKDKDFCVPFMAASAAVFDTEKFSNVEIKGGKIISDGERIIAVGAAFPGLKKSLGLDDFKDADIDIPESFEISADVTDFSMGTSVTVVSNEIFSELDFSEEDTVNDIKNKMDELSKATNELCSGTTALYDGIKKFI